MGEYKTGGKSGTAIRSNNWDAHTIKIKLCFKSVLGMTLNCIRSGGCNSGTQWCYPFPTLHPGPRWPRVVQPDRAPIQGTSWPPRAQSFGLDSILGEHNTASKPHRKQPQITKSIIFSCGQKPSYLRSHSTRWKMTMLYFKRRVPSFADSLQSLHGTSSCDLQNNINGFLKLLEKSLFFLQNTSPVATPLHSNTRQTTTASVPLPIHQTHSDQNLQTQYLHFGLTAQPQCHSPAKCKWCYN